MSANTPELSSKSVDQRAYFSQIRREILPLLPEGCDCVLEVGCGTGETLRLLKLRGLCRRAVGIELCHNAAEIARTHLDFVYEGDVEQLELSISQGSFSAILCLDVLEHLVNPEKVIQSLHSLLAPGGVIIASIPNVRHHSALLPLLLRGEWNYTDWGILDRTHLRFFVRNTALRLMESSGLKVESVHSTYGGEGDRLWDRLSFGLFRPFLELQYLIRARRVD
jgi:2-polyprenyl-3-methyl-5-hydroxy-6-metoxy-1,4-benzoquinol methylase